MDEPYMTLSGLQHFAFCRRQWALIFIEQQWAENERTVQGTLLHSRAHSAGQVESRGDLLIVRGMKVHSERLKVTGVCDVVEFHRGETGISLAGREGLWTPYPVEYKRGAPKSNDVDELQLCGQAICLEEMLLCSIEEGSLFYGETRRRVRVPFSPEMRSRVEALLQEMRQHFLRGHTPNVRRTKGCNACSLKEVCLPQMGRAGSVHGYIHQRLEEVDR